MQACANVNPTAGAWKAVSSLDDGREGFQLYLLNSGCSTALVNLVPWPGSHVTSVMFHKSQCVTPHCSSTQLRKRHAAEAGDRCSL